LGAGFWRWVFLDLVGLDFFLFLEAMQEVYHGSLAVMAAHDTWGAGRRIRNQTRMRLIG
jgi:hypothetical protein